MIPRVPLRQLWTRLRRDRRGATAIEYGLIVALIVIAMIAGLVYLANTTNRILGNVSGAVTRNSPGA